MPERFFRNEIVHRSLRGGDPDETVIGCGFMLKPGKYGQHVNVVFTKYSGVLVIRGEGTYVDWHGRKHRTFPGCFLQRLPGLKHSTIHPETADWAECYIDVSRDFCATLARMNCIDTARPVLNPGLSPALVERFDVLLSDLRGAPPDDLPRILAGAHALIVDIYALDRRARRSGPSGLALEEAARRLSSDSTRRINLPALARELGIGYEAFRKTFKERFGTAPGDFLIRRRMERARSMLARGTVTVKETAFALGYPNEFAFSRQFSRVYGAPPSRFKGVP